MIPGIKKYFLLLFLALSANSFAQTAYHPDLAFLKTDLDSTFRFSSSKKNSNQNIGTADSVIFNLAAAYQLSSFVDVPVFIRSSSAIYSLDFAIRYDEQSVNFDSLIVLNGTLQYLYYYNQQDSTLRFTSSNPTPLLNDSSLVILRFQVFSSPMCSNDIQYSIALLNGDLCSDYVSNCIISGNPETEEEKNHVLFPNPARDFININTKEPGYFQLFDIEGKSLSVPILLDNNSSTAVNISRYAPGIYFYRFFTTTKNYTGKIFISR